MMRSFFEKFPDVAWEFNGAEVVVSLGVLCRITGVWRACGGVRSRGVCSQTQMIIPYIIGLGVAWEVTRSAVWWGTGVVGDRGVGPEQGFR